MTRPVLRLLAATLCAALAACAGGGSPPPPPRAPEPPAGADLLFLRQGPAFAPDAVTAVLATEVEAAAFRGWFAAYPELWTATAPLSEPMAGTAVIAFVQPVGCDTVGGAVLEVREGRYALGLRDVARHQECLVAHQAVAAFRIPAPADPDPPPALGPGGDPAVYVAAPGEPARAFEVTDADDPLFADVREPVAARLAAGMRVFGYVVDGCDGVRPLLVVDPTALRVPACAGGVPHLAVFAVPDRLVPPGARPV